MSHPVTQLLGEDEAAARLQAYDILPTQQRVQIAQVLLTHDQHLSADQVLELVNATGSRVISDGREGLVSDLGTPGSTARGRNAPLVAFAWIKGVLEMGARQQTLLRRGRECRTRKSIGGHVGEWLWIGRVAPDGLPRTNSAREFAATYALGD